MVQRFMGRPIHFQSLGVGRPLHLVGQRKLVRGFDGSEVGQKVFRGRVVGWLLHLVGQRGDSEVVQRWFRGGSVVV